ncbi:DUF6493 family protein [Pontivivens ytuae]|uniref:HEAT repeat domain-containing protein n=1 Tax=Pontivivens ytuae TaxID=2789856 RepID=A0A7S9QEG2_9RHOB|nr:DUF6493 family protein [Pontivivens ytuae]QPH55372.1 hypothetical protein I0K15_06440 [Pontivivens ytuae]
MTEDEALELASTAKAATALTRFAAVDEATRRKLSKPVNALWKAYWRAEFSLAAKTPAPPNIRDHDALRIAMLATGTPSELKPYGFHSLPREIDLVEVMRALRPSWLDRYVADLIEGSAYLVWQVAPLWREGLCTRPETDHLILGYYAHGGGARLAAEEPRFASHDVWRFFEVEGGGDLSLAAVDKYTQPEHQWATVLLDMSRAGTLDRSRVLDASLDALERDFGQFRAGWYSRFHTALDPSLEEMTERSARYLRLVSSPIPPTVSFVLKALKVLEKAGRLEADDVLAEIGPALQARQKSTVTGAMQILASVVKRAPDRASEVARLAATALISEAADVQARALDLIERLNAVQDPELQVILAAHLDAVAPSLRPRLAAMVGAALREPAEPLPSAAAQGATAIQIEPVQTVDDAITLFLEVLENCRDPFTVERAVDGIARFGVEALASDKLSPVAKRCRQLLERPGDVELRTALAATGVAWVEGKTIDDTMAGRVPKGCHDGISRDGFTWVFARRNQDVLAGLRAGLSGPLLSLPSDTSGRVHPADLVERLAAYSGASIPRRDLALALMRLSSEGRQAALDRLEGTSEPERAFAFALGAAVTPESDAALWVAAWAARSPDAADPDIVRLVGAPVAGGGTPTALSLNVTTRSSTPYIWPVIDVEVTPPSTDANEKFASSLFHLKSEYSYLHANPCGHSFEDIAWSSTVWPGHMEPFFAVAVLALDTDQKLTDHHCRAFLEPFFRPDPPTGPLALATLGYYLASADRSVTDLAVDAISGLVEEGRIPPDAFAAQLWPFLAIGALPLGRWLRAFRDLAALSGIHAAFVRAVMTGLLRFDPEEPPRELGAMLELLFELHVETGARLDDPAVRAFLQQIRSGGKAGRFAKKLLSLGDVEAASS